MAESAPSAVVADRPVMTPDERSPYTLPIGPGAQIFLISVLGLFLELLLIRWIATEIRIFAYLQNTVLVVCFLGLGMGCFTCRQPIRMRDALIPLCIITVLLAIPYTRHALGTISTLLGVLPDIVVWDQRTAASMTSAVVSLSLGAILTFILMAMLWDIFIPIGRLLGRAIDDHPRTIVAYSINIFGSIVGTWLFVALSAVHAPPGVWFVVLALLLVFFLGSTAVDRRWNGALTACILVAGWLAGWEPGAEEVYWSPYQKLALLPVDHPQVKAYEIDAVRGSKFVIMVNNAGYQAAIDLTPEEVAKHPDRFPEAFRGCSQYDIPCRLHPNPQEVLIVGAGCGNDTAGALRNGAGHVTAVEIDPMIISMGQRKHPEKPYDSPKVTVVLDDARAYFAATDKKFDVISFGLLDSHTTGAMTNARLDHFVYTQESLAQVRKLLKPGGIVVLSFEAARPFIADRMARLIRDEFQSEPMSFRVPLSYYGWGGQFFVTGDLAGVQQRLAGDPQLQTAIDGWRKEFPQNFSYTTPVTTDDWPYIYLDQPNIPVLYYVLAGLLVLLFVRGQTRLPSNDWIRGWSTTHWHFLFLGAAFMLLEVQNISKAAAVLGSTWSVNAVIITGVLVMALCANGIAARWPKLPLLPVYGCLWASCIALYFVDLAQFNAFSYPVKAVLVGGLTTLPMIFSGIVFIRALTGVVRKDQAFGANLFGALIGALLQTSTFVIGLKALLLVVAALYFLAFLTRPKLPSAAGEEGAGEGSTKTSATCAGVTA